MLLTITTTHQPATDLGYLLGKHPQRFQSKELSFGQAHVFYPEAGEEKCTAALLLEVNPVALARNWRQGQGLSLDHYINDRPYVASSFLTTAIAKVMGSAMNGNCRDRPELAETAIPLEAEISVVASRGGETMIRRFFEPLGYTVELENSLLDTQFPEWGPSPYFRLKLCSHTTLQLLLSHLYVLLPALDHAKHYYVGPSEVDKLLDKGGSWLKSHPAGEGIIRRYLKHRGGYAREALRLLSDGNESENPEEIPQKIEEQMEEKLSLHQIRLHQVVEQLRAAGARTVLDLGCGSGKLLQLLLREEQFEKIVGMDISYKSLESAKSRLHLDEAAPKLQERIQLIHGALTYQDDRLAGFDAGALVEVIEHLDPDRLEAMERVVFGYATPKTVIITTPNREYNALFENLSEGKFRHPDHRFEWTRAEFREWAEKVAAAYGYVVEIRPLGPEDERYGAPSQMGIFKINS